MQKLPCIRCGVCCSSGACSYGIEDNNGICSYLIIHNKTTSCKIMIDKGWTTKEMGLDGGCLLRRLPEVYSYYLNEMRLKLKSKKIENKIKQDAQISVTSNPSTKESKKLTDVDYSPAF